MLGVRDERNRRRGGGRGKRGCRCTCSYASLHSNKLSHQLYVVLTPDLNWNFQIEGSSSSNDSCDCSSNSKERSRKESSLYSPGLTPSAAAAATIVVVACVATHRPPRWKSGLDLHSTYSYVQPSVVRYHSAKCFSRLYTF
jgi:hypothetical protein